MVALALVSFPFTCFRQTVSGAAVFTGVPKIPAAAMRRIAAGTPDPFFYSGCNVVDLGLLRL